MRSLWLPAGFLCAAIVLAQTTAFEVASIKPSKDAPGSSGIDSDNGGIHARNVTLRRCIRGAYNLPEVQILGGPKWVDDERYEIIAKATGSAGDQEMMLMLQSLLADRFKLAVHRETKILSGYALVPAKGGIKAKVSPMDSPSRTSWNRGRIEAQRCTMAKLAQRLSDALRVPVADLTENSGEFDFLLEWSPDDASARPPNAADSAAPAGPTIFTALQEQLGLKLESRKIPAEVLVIDHAEPPSEN